MCTSNDIAFMRKPPPRTFCLPTQSFLDPPETLQGRIDSCLFCAYGGAPGLTVPPPCTLGLPPWERFLLHRWSQKQPRGVGHSWSHVLVGSLLGRRLLPAPVGALVVVACGAGWRSSAPCYGCCGHRLALWWGPLLVPAGLQQSLATVVACAGWRLVGQGVPRVPVGALPGCGGCCLHRWVLGWVLGGCRLALGSSWQRLLLAPVGVGLGCGCWVYAGWHIALRQRWLPAPVGVPWVPLCPFWLPIGPLRHPVGPWWLEWVPNFNHVGTALPNMVAKLAFLLTLGSILG